MSDHKLLQDKVAAFERAVRHGDVATALTLLGDVAREAEARGVARCALAARQQADQTQRRAGVGAAPGDAARLADLFDGWAGTTRPAAPAEPTAPGMGRAEHRAEVERTAFHEERRAREAAAGTDSESEPEPEPEAGEEEEPAPRRRKGKP